MAKRQGLLLVGDMEVEVGTIELIQVVKVAKSVELLFMTLENRKLMEGQQHFHLFHV